MADETARIVKRKQIELPGGGTVDIPVITQITFRDSVDRGQETQYNIDNSAQAHRDVHVASVADDGTTNENAGTGGVTSGGGSPASTTDLLVERIDLWRVKDPVERSQETFIAPDSKTVAEPPDAPPYFTTHKKTHIVRYINTPDDGASIDSELIDELDVKDPVDRGWQTHYTLSNPPNNANIDGITIGDTVDGTDDGSGTGTPISQIQVDPTFDDISDTANGIDPPWRLDPFQNIVGYNAGLAVLGFYGDYGRPAPGYMIGSLDGVLWKDNVFISSQNNNHAMWDAAYGDGVWIGYDIGEFVGTGEVPPSGAAGIIWKSDDAAKTWQRTSAAPFISDIGTSSLGRPVWPKVIGFLPPPKPHSGQPPSPHKPTGTFVSALDDLRIGYSTDDGDTWTVSLDITDAANADNSLQNTFKFCNQAGDYVFVGSWISGVGNYYGTDFVSEPYVQLWRTADGKTWDGPITLFDNVDWHQVDPGVEGAANFLADHSFVFNGGVAYDDKNKKYFFAVAFQGTAAGVVAVTSDNGLSWGAPVTLGEAHTQAYPPAWTYYGGAPGNPINEDSWFCGQPAGGNGLFVLPGAHDHYVPSGTVGVLDGTSQPGVWVVDSSSGGGGPFQILGSSSNTGSQGFSLGTATVYFKNLKGVDHTASSPHGQGRGGFITAAENFGPLGNLGMSASDNNGQNWRPITNPDAAQGQIGAFALGKVGSWASDKPSSPLAIKKRELTDA